MLRVGLPLPDAHIVSFVLIHLSLDFCPCWNLQCPCSQHQQVLQNLFQVSKTMGQQTISFTYFLAFNNLLKNMELVKRIYLTASGGNDTKEVTKGEWCTQRGKNQPDIAYHCIDCRTNRFKFSIASFGYLYEILSFSIVSHSLMTAFFLLVKILCSHLVFLFYTHRSFSRCEEPLSCNSERESCFSYLTTEIVYC